MKKGLISVFILLLVLGAIAGLVIAVNNGHLDNAFANAFNVSNSSSEIVEVVSEDNTTTSEDGPDNQERLLEQLQVTLQKRNKEGDNLKLIYSYQIINGTSAALTYSVRGGLSQGDVSVTYQNNHDGNLITVEIVHPFTGEGVIEFVTVNGARKEVLINLSEWMVSSITIEDGLPETEGGTPVLTF